jgi:superfamily II DNA or RNA helicase
MKIDSAKLARQEQGIQAWVTAGAVGTLNWPTGFGKTFTGASLVIARMLAKTPDARIIVVVPSDQLRHDWREAISTFIGETDKVLVETIHYFQEKRVTFECRLVIYDEIHEYLSDDRKNIFDTWITAKFKLGLTATYEDRHLRHTYLEKALPIVDKITEAEALENKWISEFVVFNLMLELDEKEQAEYDKQSKYINEQMPKFKGDFTLAQKCLSGGLNYAGIFQNADYFCRGVAMREGFKKEMAITIANKSAPPQILKEYQAIASLWAPEMVKGYAGMLLKAVKRRKELLYESHKKVEAAHDIILKLSESRFIVFSQSTAYVDRLVGELTRSNVPTAAYHSNLSSFPLRIDKKTKKPSLVGTGDFVRFKSGDRKGKPKPVGAATLKKLAIEELRDGKLRGICTGSALDKGFDEKTISLGIAASFTSTGNQMKQRKGRTTRINPEEAEVPVIMVNLVFNNTIEQHWLQQAQATEDVTKIFWINSIEQISINPNESVTENVDFYI